MVALLYLCCVSMCSVSLPHIALGRSAVCDCGIYSSYLIAFSLEHIHIDIYFLRSDLFKSFVKKKNTTRPCESRVIIQRSRFCRVYF